MKESPLAYRFDYSDLSSWTQYLEENGYVVIGNFLNSEECQSTLKEMRSTLAYMSPKLSLEDESTWTSSSNYPYNGINMVQWIGQSKFQWDMRAKLAPLFASLWKIKETELATSFDGFCYMDGRRNYNLKPMLNNLHTDQSPMNKGLWSYQGLVNLLDNGEDDGGFVVVPKTHKIHEDYLTNKLGWGEIPVNYLEFSEEQKQDDVFKAGLKVCAKAGDVILWDSRTFHGNTLPKSENLRACVYVCQLPKAHVDEDIRKQRKKAFEEARCSTHHPGSGFELFDEWKENKEEIREKTKKVSLEWEELSDLQKSLVCAE